MAATVNFHLRGQWDDLWARITRGEDPLGIGPQAPFDGVVLADFPALPVPPGVRLWYADHHQTPYNLTASPAAVQSDYEARATRGETVLHAHTESCADLLETHLRSVTPPADRARWADLAAMATRSDRVRYQSLEPREDPALGGDLLIENLSPAEAGQLILGLQRGQTWAEAVAPFQGRLAELDATWQLVRLQQRVRTQHPVPGLAVVLPGAGRREDVSVGMRLAKMLPFQLGGVSHSLWFEERVTERGLSWQGSLGRHPSPQPLANGLAWPDLSRVMLQLQETLPVEGGGHPYAVGVRLYPTETGEDAAALYQRMMATLTPLLQPVPITHPLADQASVRTTEPSVARPVSTTTQGTAPARLRRVS